MERAYRPVRGLQVEIRQRRQLLNCAQVLPEASIAMRVTELSLDQLDFWVACAREIKTYHENGNLMYSASPRLPPRKWSPTRYWSQGGPLIEASRIDINWDSEGNGRWTASLEPDVLAEGDSLLVAAMRALVIARFGDEVPVEE